MIKIHPLRELNRRIFRTIFRLTSCGISHPIFRQTPRQISEQGRGMTEMIGVLVIVGVLTLGFVWGFPWAMDKYRAIKTIEDVRTRAVECSSQLINRNLCDLGNFDTMTSQGYNWILGIDPNDVSTFDITVQKVPINDAGECVTLECPADVSAITDQKMCQRCNSKWNCTNVNDERVCSCSKAQCATNADCGPKQYCGGSTASCQYPTYNTCVNVNYVRLSIQHNGQTESWYIFNNAMSWWDAVNACQSIGKSLQPKEVIYERWKALGSFWWRS